MASKSTSKTYPGFDKVYDMHMSGGSRAFHADIALPSGCKPFGLLRGDYSPSKPIEVTHALGRGQPSDVIWMTNVGPVVVSDKVTSLLESHAFSGWSTYPVVVRNKAGDIVDGYAGLSITGRCGKMDNSRCEIVEREFPGGIFPVYRGLYFDESQWDGSDIFCSADETGWLFVTHDVKRAFEKAKIRNVVFTATSDVERSML